MTGLTNDIGIISAISYPCWLTYHDSDRWPQNGPQVPASSMTWAFEMPQHHHECSSLMFSVIYDTGEPTRNFSIHRNLMLMLGYLDLDYWSSPIKETTRWNQNRISHYLRLLREDVVVELAGVKENVLEDLIFGTNTLREWAVRAHAGYGHSQTGRREYLESCSSVTPYAEDFINYGESQISRT
jgi:hypothetical protein